MMHRHTTLLMFALFAALQAATAQGYTSYFTGNATDVVTSPQGGVCLMGGAGEDDNAMAWFLERVNGGDVLVLRCSGSDGYNDYLYSELGVDVNSVETLVFANPNAADLPEIHERIAQAEGIWFAGGDQWDYVSFWRDTPVAQLINQGIAERNVVVGGISAGMAILGQYYFSAVNGTVTSAAALNSPYNTDVVVDSTAFLTVPFMERVVTDTHYNDPDRKGRHTVFLARALTDYGTITRGIACDEYTAVCIDETGTAHVFGEYPEYEDTAYFIAPNCELADPAPEVCASNNALEWNHGGEALKVYEVKGTTNGSNTFDLTTWQTGEGGTWMHWHVVDGTFNESEGTAPACTVSASSLGNPNAFAYPNPASNSIRLACSPGPVGSTVRVFNSSGQQVVAPAHWVGHELVLDCASLPDGMYHVQWGDDAGSSRFVVAH